MVKVWRRNCRCLSSALDTDPYLPRCFNCVMIFPLSLPQPRQVGKTTAYLSRQPKKKPRQGLRINMTIFVEIGSKGERRTRRRRRIVVGPPRRGQVAEFPERGEDLHTPCQSFDFQHPSRPGIKRGCLTFSFTSSFLWYLIAYKLLNAHRIQVPNRKRRNMCWMHPTITNSSTTALSPPPIHGAADYLQPTTTNNL